MQIIPGILENNWQQIEEKIEKIKTFSNTIHIDLIDGKFSPNTTFLDPNPFTKYSTELFFEVHLMTENPLSYLDLFARAGFKRFIGHIEKMPDIAKFIAKGQLIGEVGIAIDLNTNIENISIPFDDLDFILVMGVVAGASGQSLNPEVFKKIKTLREKTSIPIEVDGGVSSENIVDLKNAGVNRCVTTSFLFNSPNPKDAYQSLLSQVNN
ncbi:MAG: hypothetical protein AAB532_01920 [Patescibacteria group bacterium]